jgi:T4 RnlA family RNA ligase
MYNNIPTFDQCLDLCEKHNCFSHSIQNVNGYDVHSFKYNLVPPVAVWKEFGAINMRGITFIDKKLVALPFPKFFNLNENELSTVDISNFKYAIEKVDGSLISVFKLPTGKLEIKTMKSVYSEVANIARDFLKDNKQFYAFCELLLNINLSPIFEFVSKETRVVIDYGSTDIYLLGARELTTGEIINSRSVVLDNSYNCPLLNYNLKRPKFFTNDNEIQNYLKQSNVEGIVFTLQDNSMIKCKTSEYCDISRVISVCSPKHILEAIFNKTIDDSKSILLNYSMNKELLLVKQLEIEYYNKVTSLTKSANDYINNNKSKPRKEIAAELLPHNKELANNVFAILSNKNSKIEQYVFSNLLELYKNHSYSETSS